ncbi:hypothetical protein ABEX29_12215 [Brevibacillus porteri]|uniref:hypothetical protein n=1 Tax=Brevibacillus porteri TaxID=2126350 RepID=UPI00035EEAE1|nr:hypothetical protein A616_25500 [Brevibacillus brevis X23]
MKVSKLRSGQEVIIRLGKITDAEAFIAFVHRVSGESDHLSFGQQEWTVTPDEQKENIKRCLETHNQLFLMAEVDGRIVGNLTFRGGIRSRTQHVGEFGIGFKEFGTLTRDFMIEDTFYDCLYMGIEID